MINEKLLDEAILEVCKKRMGDTLRHAIIHDTPEMGEVYSLYLKKVERKKFARAEMRFQIIGWVAVAVGVVIAVKVLS